MPHTSGPQPTAVPPPAGAEGRLPAFPPAARADLRQMSYDRYFALLGGVLWAGNAVKMAPKLDSSSNLQSLLGLAAILLVSLAWPSLRPAGYCRWRVPALASLRLFLMCLPFTYDTAVLDALVPGLATGRLSWLANVANLFTGTNMDFLWFTALGWPLPPRVHMPLQAVQVALLACFGLGPHCRSKLLSAPEVAAAAERVHGAMSVLVEIFLPAAAFIHLPRDLYSQTAMVLLYSWIVLGWLAPTLLLLWPVPPPAAARVQAHQPADASSASGGSSGRWQPAACLETAAGYCATACDVLVASLQAMLGKKMGHDVPQVPPGGSPLFLRWVLFLLGAWLVCSAAAPLYPRI